MEDGAEADDAAHRVVKVRLKHLLTARRHVERIQYGVETMHTIVGYGLVLGKLLYLSDLDRELAANGGNFDAEVARRVAAAFPIDKGQMEDWLDVVSSPLAGRVGRPYGAAKALHLQRLHAFYDDRASAGLLPLQKTPCTNLSNPKGHAAAQMEVNYRNNVHCHFDKYVKRFVRVRMTAATRLQHGLDPDVRIPSELKRALDTDIRTLSDDLLQARAPPRCREALVPWLDQHRPALLPPAPAAAAPHWRFQSQKEHPERWLPYMVMIDRWLEGDGTKLLSPLPQRTSFVPSHVRLDTNGLIDLLVDDADDMPVLKAALEDSAMPADEFSAPESGPSAAVIKYELPGLMSRPPKGGVPKVCKAMLYTDLKGLVSPRLAETVRKEPAKHAVAFKTTIWRCLTKLGSNKHAAVEHKDLVFNNVIDTDGHSVSLHYVSRSLHGLTRFNGGFKALVTSQRRQAREEKARGATYVTSLTEAERVALLERRDGGGSIAACDPGKKSLATVTDGWGRVVSYSAAQRRVESGSRKHAREHRRLLDVRVDPGARSAGELLRSIGEVPDLPGVVRSAKSCVPEHYAQYLRSRVAVEAPLKAFYRRPVFRAHRYDAYVGRRASEDRFVSRIKSAFGSDVTILYGGWGRAPNLRHQPPSPGVGLRRRLCSDFRVYLVHEAYTSSRCPRCCGREVTKPRRDNRTGEEVHHLLKCADRRCSCHWWNRDVLGALNILKTGEHALRTGAWDPLFAA